MVKSIEDAEVIRNAQLLEEENRNNREQERTKRLQLIDLNLHNIKEQAKISLQNKQLDSEIEVNYASQAKLIQE